jgi:hypothetical protein
VLAEMKEPPRSCHAHVPATSTQAWMAVRSPLGSAHTDATAQVVPTPETEGVPRLGLPMTGAVSAEVAWADPTAFVAVTTTASLRSRSAQAGA